MRNKFSVLVILTFSQLNSVFAEPIRFIERPTIYISDTSILTVNQDAQTTLESFVRNWSQFEILVDKKFFPIEAPNCKQTIQIRFKGMEPFKNQGGNCWNVSERAIFKTQVLSFCRSTPGST